LADENRKLVWEKVKFQKFSMESKKFVGNRGEIWNRGDNASLLQGDGRPCLEHVCIDSSPPWSKDS